MTSTMTTPSAITLECLDTEEIVLECLDADAVVLVCLDDTTE